ncbi:ubiquitin-conjugating enzyme/RWD-like protein [Tirmania nivea]|nr:ubiquitin-conjugating enzyme/RWD-like protein [Tirmania nivea]
MARANTPTIKRILREAAELSSHPTPDIHAHPLSDSSLFEWHFTIRGPPPPSPFSAGIYHGRISLPTTYPLRPPSFRFLTPSGRFEVNREICLSISGHHEETWQPAWGIRTALVAIRAFMDSEVGGQVGGLECSAEGRRELAAGSRVWRCRECEGGLTNEEVLERERSRWVEMGRDGKGDEGEGEEAEKVPEELRLAYREDLGGTETPATESPSASGSTGNPLDNSTPTPTTPLPQPQTQPVLAAAAADLRQRIPNPPPPPLPAPQLQQPIPPQALAAAATTTLDKVILFLLVLLGGLLWRKLGKVDVEIVF